MRDGVALLVAVAAIVPIGAAEVETQHAFDITLPLQPRVELVLHSRIRTQPDNLGFYQVRAGSILSWRIQPRVAVIGGYYYTQQEQIDNDFIGGHRPFGGGEILILEARRFSLDQRLLAERFLSDGPSDFSRYRFRTRASAKGSFAPYTTYEFFADAEGWRSARYSGGVRWTALPVLQLDFGYFYEHRRANVGPNRHMWITSIHLTRSSRRADPDR